MMSNANLTSRYDEHYLQSKTIDFLRFPLAIAVIFIHINPKVVNLIDADFKILTEEGLLNIIEITFSHVLAGIAVPCFFLISGLLFFINYKKWNWSQYNKKLKSRVRTLLIPYLIWNITPWLIYIIVFTVQGIKDNSFQRLVQFLDQYNFNILYNCHQWNESRIDWLGNNLLMTGPLNLPLWFLRDLIFMVIITPLIYFFIKKFKIWYILILFIAYISRIWTILPGFSITSCFFFSLGAYFSLNNINIIDLVRKYNLIFIIVSVILLLISIVYDGNNTLVGQNIYPFFILTSVFSAFYITSCFVYKFKAETNKLLISSCFFIYAFHAVSLPFIGNPLIISGKVMDYVLSDYPIICYLFTPFFTAVICIIIMIIGKKIFPFIIQYYTGNR